MLSKQLEGGGSNWYSNTSVGIFNSSALLMLLLFAYSISIMIALVVLKISPLVTEKWLRFFFTTE